MFSVSLFGFYSILFPSFSVVSPSIFPRIVLFLLHEPPVVLDEFVAEAAAQTVPVVAIHLFELYDGLAVGSRIDVHPTFAPHPYDAVVLGFQFFEETEGTVAKRLVVLVSAVGEEDGDDGVEYDDADGLLRQLFGRFPALAAKRIVRLPIASGVGVKQVLQLLYRPAAYYLTQSCPAVIIQVGKLRNSDVREVLRTEP